MTINPTILEAWQANRRANLTLLEHLDSGMLEAGTPGGGFTVAEQLAHMAGTTTFWGLQLDDIFEKLTSEFDPETGRFAGDPGPDGIREVMEQVAQTAYRAAERADGPAGLPHPSADAYLVHMMNHDAHHRGQILLALKTAGHPLPDEDLMWGPWRGE